MFLNFLKDFIYLRTTRSGEAGAEGEGEANSSSSREPNMGLNPRTQKSEGRRLTD